MLLITKTSNAVRMDLFIIIACGGKVGNLVEGGMVGGSKFEVRG